MAVIARSPYKPVSGREKTRDVAWRRLTALAGATFFALVIVYATMRSGAPSASDPGKDVVDYVTRHAGRLQLGAGVITVAMAASGVWLAGLFRVLWRAEGRAPGLAVAAIGGGAVAAASTATAALIQGTIATRIDDLSAETARVWWTAYLLSTGAIALGLLIIIGVTTVLWTRHHLFAAWFAVLSALLTVLSLVGVFTIGSGAVGLQTAAGLAVLLDSAWMFVVGLFVARDRTPDLA